MKWTIFAREDAKNYDNNTKQLILDCLNKRRYDIESDFILYQLGYCPSEIVMQRISEYENPLQLSFIRNLMKEGKENLSQTMRLFVDCAIDKSIYFKYEFLQTI